jgi:hypothetical protein
VIEYLLTRVLLIRMPIDRTTDLNRYFEIMNTRGAQLSPVDIVKARLLRHLTDPLDRKLLNRVWTACADMEHYVGMTVTAGDAQLRAEVFGPDWDSVPSADFTRLRAQLIDGPSEDNTARDEEELPPTSSAMTLDEAVTTYAATPSTRNLWTQTAGTGSPPRSRSRPCCSVLAVQADQRRSATTGSSMITNKRFAKRPRSEAC